MEIAPFLKTTVFAKTTTANKTANYQKADKKTLVAAESIARGQFDDDDILLEDTTTIDVENSENQSEEESIPVEIDPETGEVLPANLK